MPGDVRPGRPSPWRDLLAMKLFAARAEIDTDDIIPLHREFSGR
jgi:hypothetical protein